MRCIGLSQEVPMKQFDFKKIKEFRTAAKMSQDTLAFKISLLGQRVYVQQVSDWENKTSGGFSVTHLAKICEVLGKTPEDFFIDQP
jgi:transcriptional regulator with XRE-family HTH domain